jgi:hypothetical protein
MGHPVSAIRPIQKASPFGILKLRLKMHGMPPPLPQKNTLYTAFFFRFAIFRNFLTPIGFVAQFLKKRIDPLPKGIVS